MNKIAKPVKRPTLDSALRKAHSSVALIAVLMAGLTIGIAGLIMVRVYSDQNLRLVARSMSYTVEAAVVFKDAAAAQDALALIGAHEDIDEARLTDTHGMLLTQWKRADHSARYRLEQQVGKWLLPNFLMFPITHDNTIIGQIRLTPHSRGLLQFMLSGMIGLFACLVFSTSISLRFAKRIQAEITGPMRDLAKVAHRVRRDRSFDLRVPPADIAELNTLNHDFNALLDELESWQMHLQKEHASLAHRANHDSLTGLSNRAFLVIELERAIANAKRDNERVAVLFLDSDRFKQINDQYGHASGDSVLIAVASRIKAQVREGDLVARLGGDEFAILLKSLHHSDAAINIADNIISAMHAPIALPVGTSIVTSLSIGIAVFPEHGNDAISMLAAADEAMYQAKQICRGSRRLAGQPTIFKEA
jgi:diguanylate cyclase (GGDEF)-like protein